MKKAEKEKVTVDADEILILTGDPVANATRGAGAQHLKIDELIVNVNIFVQQMGKVLENTPEKVGKFHFDEFEIYADITADGKIALLGTGVQAGASAGMHFTFRRSMPESKG